MASSSDRPIQANVTLAEPTVLLIETLDLPIANTEYFYQFPSGLRKYRIQNRTRGIIKYSNLSGFTTAYETLWPGLTLEEDNVGGINLILYFQSPVSSQTLEVISWTL